MYTLLDQVFLRMSSSSVKNQFGIRDKTLLLVSFFFFTLQPSSAYVEIDCTVHGCANVSGVLGLKKVASHLKI